MYRIIVPVAIVVTFVLFIYGVEEKRTRADFVFANRGDVFTLDPQRMSWLTDMQVAYCVYEGVVGWNNQDFSVEPTGSDSFSISDDRQTYVFKLKRDARWSNGAKVTAYDYQYAWMRLLTPDTSSDYSSFFFVIRGATEFWDWRTAKLKNKAILTLGEVEEKFKNTVGIRVLDEYTIQVELEYPVPYFLDQLAMAVCSPVFRPSVEGWVLSEEEMEQVVSEGWYALDPPPLSARTWISVDKETGRISQQYFWARPETLVSNGPFMLKEWRYKRDMLLERNPYYHTPEVTQLDSIQAVTIPDANTAVLAFESGQLDWLSSVNVDYQSDMLKQKVLGERSNVHAFPTFGTDFFSFNCRPTLASGASNPLHSAAVRRAFVLATNRDAIVKYATRLHEPTVNSFVPPNSIRGYGNVDGLEFNPTRAKEELDSAGWIDRDGDGVLENEAGVPFQTIDLLYTTNTPRYKWMALELRDQWEKTLGVRVELRGTDNKFFSADLHSGNFMVARGRWYGDYGDPTTFLDVFRSNNGNNDRGFVDKEIDLALDRAAVERNSQKRLDMLRDIEEQLFTEEVPMVVICQLLQLYMYDPERVSGLTEHPRLVQQYWRVSVDKD